MKELMTLISYSDKDYEGRLEHRSAWNYEGNGKTIFFYEKQDDEEGFYTATPSEYWEKLSSRPKILDSLSKYDLKWLRDSLGETKSIAIYQVDFALSVSEIAFYFIYDFKKLRADFNVDTMNVKVFERLKHENMEYQMPFDDFITLNSIVRDKVNEMDLELQKLQCGCGYTFYVDGMFDPHFDKCNKCHTGADVVVIDDYVHIHKVV